MFQRVILSAFFCVLTLAVAFAQGTIRGTIADKESGEAIIFANVTLEGTSFGTTTDINGFFSLSQVPEGKYQIVSTYLGYDTLRYEVTIKKSQVFYKSLYMNPSSIQLSTVNISGRREQARTEVRVSTINVTPRQIENLPSTGGEADVAQFLQVIPGVVSTGSPRWSNLYSGWFACPK